MYSEVNGGRMGTGWEYFNNVCQALRVAIGVTASVLGVVAVVILYNVIAPRLREPQGDAAPTPSSQPSGGAATIYQQAGIAPSASSTAASRSAAPARSANTSAGYGASNAAPGAGAGRSAARSSSYHPSMQPNPQFSGGGK